MLLLNGSLYIPVEYMHLVALSVLGRVYMLWLTWTNFLIMPDLRRALESWRAEGRSRPLPGRSCRAVSWSWQPRAGSAVCARGLWCGWGPAHRELCLLGPPEGPWMVHSFTSATSCGAQVLAHRGPCLLYIGPCMRRRANPLLGLLAEAGWRFLSKAPLEKRSVLGKPLRNTSCSSSSSRQWYREPWEGTLSS